MRAARGIGTFDRHLRAGRRDPLRRRLRRWRVIVAAGASALEHPARASAEEPRDVLAEDIDLDVHARAVVLSEQQRLVLADGDQKHVEAAAGSGLHGPAQSVGGQAQTHQLADAAVKRKKLRSGIGLEESAASAVGQFAQRGHVDALGQPDREQAHLRLSGTLDGAGRLLRSCTWCLRRR